MINYLAFLGFNPGGEREVYTLAELVNIFDLNKIQISGAKWNDDKLDWFNKEHLKLLSQNEIEKNILEWLPEDMRQNKISAKLVPLILERISKWSNVKEMAEAGELDFFFHAPQYEKGKLIFKNTTAEKISENLSNAISALEKLSAEEFTTENVKTTLMNQADKLEKRGELLHPVRYALSGKDQSPDPFIIASIIGKDETISRLQKAI